MTAQRRANDAYFTPAWCVDRFLEAVPLWPGNLWLEPSVGNGAMCRAVNRWYESQELEPPTWRVCDIDGSRFSELPPETDYAAVGDYVRGAMASEIRGERFSAAIGNPPYSDAFRFVKQALTQCDVVAFLLRLNWLASEERRDWLAENTPDVYVLPNRPSFTDGGGDMTEYCWMVWRKLQPGSLSGVPKLKILATTPAAERRAA